MKIQYRQKGQAVTTKVTRIVEITTLRVRNDNMVAKAHRLKYEEIPLSDGTLNPRCPVISFVTSQLYNGWCKIQNFKNENPQFRGIFLNIDNGKYAFDDVNTLFASWEDIYPNQPVPEKIAATRAAIKQQKEKREAEEATRKRNEQAAREYYEAQTSLARDILGDVVERVSIKTLNNERVTQLTANVKICGQQIEMTVNKYAPDARGLAEKVRELVQTLTEKDLAEMPGDPTFTLYYEVKEWCGSWELDGRSLEHARKKAAEASRAESARQAEEARRREEEEEAEKKRQFAAEQVLVKRLAKPLNLRSEELYGVPVDENLAPCESGSTWVLYSYRAQDDKYYPGALMPHKGFRSKSTGRTLQELIRDYTRR